MGNDVYSAGPVDVNVRPVAWLHDQPGRYDVVHDEAKAFWLKKWIAALRDMRMEK